MIAGVIAANAILPAVEGLYDDSSSFYILGLIAENDGVIYFSAFSKEFSPNQETDTVFGLSIRYNRCTYFGTLPFITHKETMVSRSKGFLSGGHIYFCGKGDIGLLVFRLRLDKKKVTVISYLGNNCNKVDGIITDGEVEAIFDSGRSKLPVAGPPSLYNVGLS